MVIGSGIIDMWIAESSSLKEKRGVLSRILKRTQNEFNVSVAEIGENDHWKRAKIGFSVVGNDKRYINSKIDHILRFIDGMQLAEILNTKIEMINVSDMTYPCHYEEGKYGGY
jgi:uncharacterized protein YlxP (DUF503 family)